MLVTGLAAAPLITALVAVIGGALPALPRRAYPALSVALGVAWQSVVLLALGEFTWQAPLAGITIGLAACGLYSGVVRPGVAAVQGR